MTTTSVIIMTQLRMVRHYVTLFSETFSFTSCWFCATCTEYGGGGCHTFTINIDDYGDGMYQPTKRMIVTEDAVAHVSAAVDDAVAHFGFLLFESFGGFVVENSVFVDVV
jgi:putative component of membrane protein insertase Oxa1/YidC/SpoIIIJ protein YidD